MPKLEDKSVSLLKCYHKDVDLYTTAFSVLVWFPHGTAFWRMWELLRTCRATADYMFMTHVFRDLLLRDPSSLGRSLSKHRAYFSIIKGDFTLMGTVVVSLQGCQYSTVYRMWSWSTDGMRLCCCAVWGRNFASSGTQCATWRYCETYWGHRNIRGEIGPPALSLLQERFLYMGRGPIPNLAPCAAWFRSILTENGVTKLGSMRGIRANALK